MAGRLESMHGRTPQAQAEKRAEPREPGSGSVRLQPDTQRPAGLVEGRLVDWSLHGFRAAHGCRSLQTGDLVHFQHDHDSGVARVVWMRITPDCVECGFLVLPAN